MAAKGVNAVAFSITAVADVERGSFAVVFDCVLDDAMPLQEQLERRADRAWRGQHVSNGLGVVHRRGPTGHPSGGRPDLIRSDDLSLSSDDVGLRRHDHGPSEKGPWQCGLATLNGSSRHVPGRPCIGGQNGISSWTEAAALVSPERSRSLKKRVRKAANGTERFRARSPSVSALPSRMPKAAISGARRCAT